MSKLYVVGIGPGDPLHMTLRASRALEASEVIAGYGVYVGLVKPLFPDKEYIVTPMGREAERCARAVACARAGRTTAIVSSGDPGVYGMAAPVLEIAGEQGVEVEIVPGVTAALAGAAALGAPLGHDFAVVSLSDLLTPWETIEVRLDAAARAGLCLAIYNPASRHRAGHLRRACEVLLRHLPPETVCGVARGIGREGGGETRVMTLAALMDYPADMFTTVFVGNAGTQVIDGRMVTPRGYGHG